MHIGISLAVGVLLALATGFLHRTDRLNPLAPNYSIQSATKRGIATLFGTTPLVLSLLRSPDQTATFFILLLAAIAGVVWALLTYFDTTTPQTTRAAIWKGAKATAAALAAGQAFLALYGKS
ncbi:hypothetical protein [Streptomyces sp. 1222.5]|uniref:hypothetical protein n=1 Tax=Streptomyces sp. 1222.5 TaxID=1881026 RepID=UPI003D73414B